MFRLCSQQPDVANQWFPRLSDGGLRVNAWHGRHSFASLCLLYATEAKGRDVTLTAPKSCSDGEFFKSFSSIEKHLQTETESCSQAEIISEELCDTKPYWGKF